LMDLWKQAREEHEDPVEAWHSLVSDPEKRKRFQKARGKGGLRRTNWDTVLEIMAAANVDTIRNYGPDRLAGFSPIPAMSMISYASGARMLQLMGGVALSFYDWYCDLPSASPETWGEQTDVPESADWYNSGFLILWGSNVPQTRTPDAHFYTEARYRGAKSVVVTPDYSEAAKFSDLWVHPKQGTDAALAMALGHVIAREFHVERKVPYFVDYVRQYTDMPMLVRLVETDGRLVPERFVRASDLDGELGETANSEWKTLAFDEKSGELVAPAGTVGFRWDDSGKWNLEEKDATGRETKLQLSLADIRDDLADVAFPYFGNREHDHFAGTDHPDVLMRKVPAKRMKLKDGEALVASVYDLFMANYGVDQGFGGEHIAKSYDDMEPYTPAWAEHITGVPRDSIITIAREFASNAEKTNGRSMVIVGAGLNHWYHMDMNYRGIINMLVMCGCVGQSGGGWSHYVGQEKLRPQTGWLPLAFGLDWSRPPRQMNSTSAFYAHTDQWRYETLGVSEIVSPTAPAGPWDGALIDYNVRAERMGWLPSAPQLETNPLTIAAKAEAAGQEPKDYVAAG
ncbi:MAG: molybdopterin-dependent oxidoreductase, partial [Methyloceanibacter sp.]